MKFTSFLKIVVPLTFALLAIGCSKKPDCDSSTVKETIGQILTKNYAVKIQFAILTEGDRKCFAMGNCYINDPEWKAASEKLNVQRSRYSELRSKYYELVEQCQRQTGYPHSTKCSDTIIRDFPPEHAAIFNAIIQTQQEAEAILNDHTLEHAVVAIERKWKNGGEKYKEAEKEWESVKNNIKYNLENMILTSKNETTGAVMCKAKLTASIDRWGTYTVPNLIYQVEKTSDGNLYVTIR